MPPEGNLILCRQILGRKIKDIFYTINNDGEMSPSGFVLCFFRSYYTDI